MQLLYKHTCPAVHVGYMIWINVYVMKENLSIIQQVGSAQHIEQNKECVHLYRSTYTVDCECIIMHKLAVLSTLNKTMNVYI